MKSFKKGNDWHFGYKAHIGVDKDSGLVHTVVGTSANVQDVTQTENLLTGEEETVNGGADYTSADKREAAIVRNNQNQKIKYQINRRPSRLNKQAEVDNMPQRKENINSHRLDRKLSMCSP